jgi:hypothetical protein
LGGALRGAANFDADGLSVVLDTSGSSELGFFFREKAGLFGNFCFECALSSSTVSNLARRALILDMLDKMRVFKAKKH